MDAFNFWWVWEIGLIRFGPESRYIDIIFDNNFFEQSFYVA